MIAKESKRLLKIEKDCKRLKKAVKDWERLTEVAKHFKSFIGHCCKRLKNIAKCWLPKSLQDYKKLKMTAKDLKKSWLMWKIFDTDNFAKNRSKQPTTTKQKKCCLEDCAFTGAALKC